MSNKYNLSRALADAARWRCLVPYCDYRSDALTRDAFERDQAFHAEKKFGHERLVRVGYSLPAAVFELLLLMEMGELNFRASGVSRRTLSVAKREQLLTEENGSLRRTALGRLLTRYALDRRAS